MLIEKYMANPRHMEIRKPNDNEQAPSTFYTCNDSRCGNQFGIGVDEKRMIAFRKRQDISRTTYQIELA